MVEGSDELDVIYILQVDGEISPPTNNLSKNKKLNPSQRGIIDAPNPPIGGMQN